MSKSIERRNNNRRDKNDFQKRNDNYNNISNKLNYVIDYELSESICNILNIPKIDFTNSVTTKNGRLYFRRRCSRCQGRGDQG